MCGCADLQMHNLFCCFREKSHKKTSLKRGYMRMSPPFLLLKSNEHNCTT